MQKNIVAIARKYIGQKEIPPNAGFKDPVFDAKMRAIGFLNGYAWCALLGKLIWLESAAEDPALQALIRRLCSPSALATYHNFAHDGTFKVGPDPKPGALVFFKHGTDPAGYLGHEGICTTGFGAEDAAGNMIYTGYTSVEGNTSSTDPNERNGDTTAEKTHKLHLPPNPHGLNLIGFVYPIE